MKIKVKVLMPGCMPSMIKKGDWVDLICADDVLLKAPQSGVLKDYIDAYGNTSKCRDVSFEIYNIPLGIAMQLPKGFEAIVAPRSSTPSKFGIICANSIGIIDGSYNGNNDEWKFPVIPLRHTFIETGSRICQFRIQLSQKATLWQKLKWFFSRKIEFIEVNDLGNPSRGGFGSTGIK